MASRSTLLRVMAGTTSAMIAPSLTLRTVPGIWLRALSATSSSRSSCYRQHIAPAGPGCLPADRYLWEADADHSHSRDHGGGNPALEAAYRVVSYTNPQGQVFHGSALVYGATVLEGAPNRVGAEAFLAFLLSERGRAMLAARGFLPADTLVGGDASAVPASLRGLIQGRYAP